MKALLEEKRTVTPAICPYCDIEADVCGASINSFRLGNLVRLNRCSSENYDNCALFLAKNLRRR